MSFYVLIHVCDNGLARHLPISAILSQSNDLSYEKLRGEREDGIGKAKDTSEKLREETPVHLRKGNLSVKQTFCRFYFALQS